MPSIVPSFRASAHQDHSTAFAWSAVPLPSVGFCLHVGQMNRVRKAFGITALPPDCGRCIRKEATYSTLTSPSLYRRMVGLSTTIIWAYANGRSHATAGVVGSSSKGPKPRVFISLGSSGPLRVLPALQKALARLPVSVVFDFRTGYRGPGARYLLCRHPSFTATAAECNVVVSHGGSGGLYPAMAAGTPVLGIPVTRISNSRPQCSKRTAPARCSVEEALKSAFPGLESLLLNLTIAWPRNSGQNIRAVR